MGLEISKRYPYNIFHPIPAKYYEDISYHDKIQIYRFTLLGDRQSFKTFVALWNFNMEVNGKILKCKMSWKGLIVERKLGLAVLGSAYVGHFSCRILCFKAKLYGKYRKKHHGVIRVIAFLAICQILIQIVALLTFLLPQGHMEMKFSKFQPISMYSFYSISTKLYEDIACRSVIQGVTFIDNWPLLKNSAALLKF